MKKLEKLGQKQVSKLTLHFVWGHISRKQTVMGPYPLKVCLPQPFTWSHLEVFSLPFFTQKRAIREKKDSNWLGPHYMFYLRILYCQLRTGLLPFLLSVFLLCLSKYKTLLFGSTAYVGNVLFQNSQNLYTFTEQSKQQGDCFSESHRPY